MRSGCLSVLPVLFLAFDLTAQEPPAPRPPKAAVATAPAPAATSHAAIEIGNGFVLPEGEVTIEELIGATARFLNRNLLINEQELAGARNSSFFFQRRLTLDALGCEEVVYNLLYQKGFAVVPLDPARQIFEVLSMNGPRAREIANRASWTTPDDVLKRPNLKEMVLTTVPLQHINATIATNALRPFFASTGAPGGSGSLTLGNVGNNSSMLLQGFRDQVAGAIRMLRQVDTPLQERDPEAFQMGQTLKNQENAITELQAQVKRLQAQVAELQKQQAEKK